MESLQDPDLNVRRATLAFFNSAVHNKPSLVRDLLDDILPLLYQETKIRRDLIREVRPVRDRAGSPGPDWWGCGKDSGRLWPGSSPASPLPSCVTLGTWAQDHLICSEPQFLFLGKLRKITCVCLRALLRRVNELCPAGAQNCSRPTVGLRKCWCFVLSLSIRRVFTACQPCVRVPGSELDQTWCLPPGSSWPPQGQRHPFCRLFDLFKSLSKDLRGRD